MDDSFFNSLLEIAKGIILDSKKLVNLISTTEEGVEEDLPIEVTEQATGNQ
jgi:hypothetical protein